jgi:hypothetical protein
MPKVTWGGDLTEDDIESAELSSFQPYAGPLPTAGVYRWTLRRAKRGKSGQGNPKLETIWVLDGSWKPEHKKYDGCPLFDHMAVMKSMNWRVKAYCAAIGVTSTDFMKRMVVDEEDIVQKIGRLKYSPDDNDVAVYINIKREPDADGNPRIALVGYLTAPEETDDDVDDDDDDEPGHGDPF